MPPSHFATHVPHRSSHILSPPNCIPIRSWLEAFTADTRSHMAREAAHHDALARALRLPHLAAQLKAEALARTPGHAPSHHDPGTHQPGGPGGQGAPGEVVGEWCYSTRAGPGGALAGLIRRQVGVRGAGEVVLDAATVAGDVAEARRRWGLDLGG